VNANENQFLSTRPASIAGARAKSSLLSVFLTAATFFGLCAGLSRAGVHHEPTCESLAHPSTPNWFNEAVFGIYFHWGIYSVPGQSLFYGMGMYEKGNPLCNYHVAHYGDPTGLAALSRRRSGQERVPARLGMLPPGRFAD
jgi:hypothetical protein